MPVLTKAEDKTETIEAPESPGRRRLLQGGLALAALGFAAPAPAGASLLHAFSGRHGGVRALTLVNIHTGEKFHGAYWQGGSYVPGAFAGIGTVLRDHRTGERHPIDPRLMDILFVLQKKLGNDNPFEVFSGYRSRATNARLRSLRHGAALHSLHMTGQACDISLPGTSLGALHNAALRLGLGGVGYYPVSGFVHVDTGCCRHWFGV